MHLERKVEATIKAALATAVSSLIAGKTVTVRTYWDEDYSTRTEAEVAPPMVMIIASPSARPVLEEPQRMIQLDVSCITQCEDDRARRELSTLYSKVRHTIETTSFDFGSGVVYGGIEIASTGSADVDEASNRWIASFTAAIHLCAESSEAHT
jgi:hypothetical protein